MVRVLGYLLFCFGWSFTRNLQWPLTVFAWMSRAGNLASSVLRRTTLRTDEQNRRRASVHSLGTPGRRWADSVVLRFRRVDGLPLAARCVSSEGVDVIQG